MESLLDKAKAIKVPNRSTGKYTKEEVELAVAFVNGDITAKQMSTVMGNSRTNAYWQTTTILKYAVLNGLVKVTYITDK